MTVQTRASLRSVLALRRHLKQKDFDDLLESVGFPAEGDAVAGGTFTGPTLVSPVVSGGTVSTAQTLTPGAAAAAVALRIGATATEGLEIKVIDETVTLTNAVEVNLTETVPAGAVILAAQMNLQSLIVGDASGDNLLAKVGLGVTADPDKYGITADLLKNTKANLIPDWAVLGSEETVCVKAAKSDGAAATEKFVAGGTVRVRIVYAALNSLDDAA